MRLAKLTLNGFKSFADPTEFRFDSAFTGIVGPNGCGKSNVVDAIKWVLGERSSKSLRGKEMIDVIFAGSAGRKPAGMAAVSLTFENPVIRDAAPGDETIEARTPAEAGGAGGDEDEEPGPSLIDRRAARRRGLPIDADIVEVERRLYRDGRSEYVINGRKARLRDIRDLFLDTGIGADAYSIIEQGKVDAMLLASPQDRRTIFEEAAGIAKYKQRRVEAERKLEKTQANLSLTREQLATADRRLKVVRGQAVKARRFRELDDELRALRLALAFAQYDEVRIRHARAERAVRDAEAGKDQAQAALAEAERTRQAAEIERDEAQRRTRQVQDQAVYARHEAEKATQRRSASLAAREEAARQADRDRLRQDECRARVEEAERAAEQLRERVGALAEALQDADRELREAEESRADIGERAAARRAEAAQRRGAAQQIERERAGLLASIAADEKRLAAARDEVARLARRLADIDGQADRLRVERDGVQADASRRAARIDSQEAELRGRDDSSATLGEDRRRFGERLSEAEQRAVRLDSRRQTLAELVESRVALGRAVQDVMARREAGLGYAGVIAPLAELVEADAHDAALVEAALGGLLRSVVVRSVVDLPSVEERASLCGRVAFVPLVGAVASDGVDAHAEELPGVRRVRSLVRPAGGLADSDADAVGALLDRLVGGAFLVRDLDAAILLASGPLAGQRLVCEDGTTLEPDGRVVAGPVASDEAGGVIQQRAELAALDTQLEAAERELTAARADVEHADTRASELNAQRQALRHSIAAEQRQLAAEQARLDRFGADADRLTRERSGVERERDEALQRAARIERDRTEFGQRAASMDRLLAEESAAAAGVEQEARSLDAAREQAMERAGACRVRVGTLGEQLRSTRLELGRLDATREDAARAAHESSQHLIALAERLGRLGTEIDEAAAAIQAAEHDARVADGALEGARAEAARWLAEADAAAKVVGARRERAQAAERAWHLAEGERREHAIRRESAEERARDELALDLAWEYPEYRQMMAEGGVTPASAEADAPRIETLRREIKALGSVNMAAIEEETQLEERNEDLARQVADLDAARDHLTGLITTLNEVSRVRFAESFEAVREQFAGPDGMFRKLFGGGKAELRLMPVVETVETPEGLRKVETDRIDVLESGIEVIAMPPGKHPRQISQLSGGEKTLTAVALLLAIFRSKPSCFCVLDEVDAALDDANVERIGAAIRAFTDLSRFIVITHNKRTMHAADVLYGVTMQERGVSTRVNVKFEEAHEPRRRPAAPGREPIASPATPPPEAAPVLREQLATMRPAEPVRVPTQEPVAQP